MAIKFYIDRAGTQQISSALTCDYAVEPNGRVTLSSSSQSCGEYSSHLLFDQPEHRLHRGRFARGGHRIPGAAIGGTLQQCDTVGNFLWRDEGSGHSKCEKLEIEPVAWDGSGCMNSTTVSCSTYRSGRGMPIPRHHLRGECRPRTFTVSTSGGTVAGIIISSTEICADVQPLRRGHAVSYAGGDAEVGGSESEGREKA